MNGLTFLGVIGLLWIASCVTFLAVARRALHEPDVHEQPAMDPIEVAERFHRDMPLMPLDHYELTESQRLIDGAFQKESN